MPRGVDQSNVDLTDLDMWARAVPYGEFARLRQEAPVAWSADEGSGFWSVTRYSDIVAASRDVRTFSSGRGVSFEDPTDEDMAARRTIIDTDPPDHTKLRKIVASTFSQRAVAVYEHFITGLTEQVLDRMPADGEPFDFVDAVAKEVPIRVIAQVMGLPDGGLDLFIDLGDRLIANTDPEITDVVWGWDDTDAYRRFPFRSPYGKRLWDLGREVVGRGGPHLCLGVHLARLEVKVVLAALARRAARFELAGEPRRIRSNFTNGLKALPVKVYS